MAYYSSRRGTHYSTDEKEDLDRRFQDDDGDDSSWGDDSDSEDERPFQDDSKHSRARAQAKEEADDDGADESAVRAELKEKKRQVLQLSVLLEALEPVPGLNANKFLDILTQPGREDVDYRDSKIVHLAKKSRNLSVALTNSKNKHAQVCKELQELKARVELEGSSGPSGNGAAVKKAEQAAPAQAEAEAQKKQQDALVSGLQKQVAELRLKLERSQDEAKKLQRVLVKEVGEEAAGGLQDSKVMEAGWRGRAQQIVMLKAKVRKLEAQLESVGSRGRGGGESDVASESGAGMSVATSEAGGKEPSLSSSAKVVDVDRKAEAELQNIERERSRLLEQAVSEKQELQAELATVRKKLEASKARSAYLEADMGKFKEQMRCLLKKARTDDELIDAQRQELDRLSKGRAAVQADRLSQQARRTLRCPPGGHKSEERKKLEKEMGLDGVDLTVVCAAAGGEERPEDVIRRLKAKMKASSSAGASSMTEAAAR